MKKILQILLILLCCITSLLAQRVDYAIQFDGIDDYVYVPQKCYPNITDDFTIELWVKPQGVRAPTPEANTGVTGTQNQRYAIYPDWGDVYGEGHSGAGLSIGTNGISVFDHAGYHMPSLLVHNTYIYEWTHVAVVFKNKQPILYVNGEKVKTGLQSTKIVHPSAYLGEVNAKYGFYQGLIDEVRVWSYSRSEEEIQSTINKLLTGNETGLAGYWSLDEGSGTTTTDMSTNDNHGTFVGGPTWIVSDCPMNKSVTPAKQKKLKVAVVEFNQKGSLDVKDAGVIVAEWMSTALHKTSSFDLYERILLQKVLEEHQLGMTGIVDEKTAAQIGKMYGVNAIITGTISKFGDTISLVVKLVDTETAKLLATADLKTDSLDDIPDEINGLAQKIIEK